MRRKKSFVFDRREFGAGLLSSVGFAANATSIATTASISVAGRSPEAVAIDEDYWAEIARAFRLDERYIVLNGGGNNPLPHVVTDALNRNDQLAASQPRPHNSALLARIDDNRRRLAPLFNCDPDELAITRNTTEGLNIVGRGLPLERGDEVLISSFDRHYAGAVFEQIAARVGITVRFVDLPLAPSSVQVIEAFERAFTARTRLVVASHVVDGWGFVLPIRALADLAHRRGAQLLADGALGFGIVPVDVRALGCDYYATSLHKWLNAPLGTGALFVRRDRISGLWPLYGNRVEPNNIRKFEEIGTRSGPTIAAIGEAIDFHQAVGPERKAARLRHLLAVATAALDGATGVSIITERDPALRSGLARIAVEGVTGRDLMIRLREQYRIYTFGLFGPPHDGVYISPNVFNSPRDMALVAAAIRAISSGARAIS